MFGGKSSRAHGCGLIENLDAVAELAAEQQQVSSCSHAVSA